MSWLHCSIHKILEISGVTSWQKNGKASPVLLRYGGDMSAVCFLNSTKAVWPWSLQKVMVRNENIWGRSSWMEITKLWQLACPERELSCSRSSLHAHFNRDNGEERFRLLSAKTSTVVHFYCWAEMSQGERWVGFTVNCAVADVHPFTWRLLVELGRRPDRIYAPIASHANLCAREWISPCLTHEDVWILISLSLRLQFYSFK